MKKCLASRLAEPGESVESEKKVKTEGKRKGEEEKRREVQVNVKQDEIGK